MLALSLLTEVNPVTSNLYLMWSLEYLSTLKENSLTMLGPFNWSLSRLILLSENNVSTNNVSLNTIDTLSFPNLYFKNSFSSEFQIIIYNWLPDISTICLISGKNISLLTQLLNTLSRNLSITQYLRNLGLLQSWGSAIFIWRFLLILHARIVQRHLTASAGK